MISKSSTIRLPSLVLLPRSAQFGYFLAPYGWTNAPYSQGNSLVFGSNAGKQCVAMSLIAILFDFMYSIRSSSDLGEIMNVGNELYTRLSQLAGQDLLMLTELLNYCV